MNSFFYKYIFYNYLKTFQSFLFIIIKDSTSIYLFIVFAKYLFKIFMIFNFYLFIYLFYYLFIYLFIYKFIYSNIYLLESYIYKNLCY